MTVEHARTSNAARRKKARITAMRRMSVTLDQALWSEDASSSGPHPSNPALENIGTEVAISSIEPKRKAAYQVVDDLLMTESRIFTSCSNQVDP